MKDIRAFARRIAEEFHPRRIILFGSYAYGTPTGDSDVDLMVVTGRATDSLQKSVEIRQRLDSPFPLDLLVRSEAELRRRYQMEDWFIREISDKGIVVYEANHARVDRRGGNRFWTVESEHRRRSNKVLNAKST